MHRPFNPPLARASIALLLASLPCLAQPQGPPGAPSGGPTAAAKALPPATAPQPPAPPGGAAALGVGPNDDCNTPLQIVGQGTFPYDLTNATTGVEGQSENLCYFFGSASIYSDVWFEWISDTTGTALIDTCGDSIDTKIAVYPYAGSCPVAGTALACNDDSCCGLQSRVSFSALTGSIYLIQVGTFPGASAGAGNLHIWVSAAANDECNSPQQLAGTGAFPFDLSGATTGCIGQTEALCSFGGTTAIYNDVWFRWTADVTGTASFQTCGSSPPDTKLAVYADAPCGSLGPALACDVGSCPGGSGAAVTVSVTIGSSYLIQVGKASPAPLGPGGGWLFICLAGTAPDTIPFCFGDGLGTPCPCSNSGLPCRGCDNGFGSGGARLKAAGTPSVGPPGGLTLVADGVEPLQPGLFFQGDSVVGGGNGVWLNDGLRCVGSNIRRLEVVLANSTGVATSTVDIAQKGGVSPGNIKYYQYWYRAPHHQAGCFGSNLTNGLAVRWSQ